MWTAPLALLFITLYCSPSLQLSLLEKVRNSASTPEVLSNSWAVEVQGGEERARELAHKYGLDFLGQIGNLENHYHFQQAHAQVEEGSKRQLHPALPEQGESFTDRLVLESDVGFVEQQRTKVMSKKTYHSPTDPQWHNQWSLLNTGQTSGGAGRDLHVEPVWKEGLTGAGVVVTVVDEGVDISSPELSGHYDSRASHDYVYYDGDPTPDPVGFGEDPHDHGTGCAGIIAMAKDNHQCGVGVAYDCNIGGVKMNLSLATDAIEASALGHQNNYIDIYSNSWGPSDYGYTVSKPGPLATNTLRNGVTRGRSGKGSIYVWAAGNGGSYYDSCAADGYSSSVYTISIGSADQLGRQADYDEQCSSKMAVTFSYNSLTFPTSRFDTFDPYDQLVTINNNWGCRDDFTGTSAATPLMSGVIALVLQANPRLTWRDVQYLVAYTANRTLLSNADWTTNAHGLKVSHKFGFGAVDALAMVTMARSWTNVPSQISERVYGSTSSGTVGSYQSFSLTFDVSSSSIVYLEHVVVTMTLTVGGYSVEYSIDDLYDALIFIDTEEELNSWLQRSHPRRGDIQVDLTAPSGTVSHLLPYRRYDFINAEGYASWPFMSVHHWGENPIGRWTLTVSFKSSSGYVSVSGVRMQLYGVSEAPTLPPTPPPSPSTPSPVPPTHSPHTASSHSSTTSTPSHPTSLKLTTISTPPHAPSLNSSTPLQSAGDNDSTNTVKYVIAGVFSVGGVLALIIVGVLVGVVLYYRSRSKFRLRFRRLATEVVNDAHNPNSVSI